MNYSDMCRMMDDPFDPDFSYSPARNTPVIPQESAESQQSQDEAQAAQPSARNHVPVPLPDDYPINPETPDSGHVPVPLPDDYPINPETPDSGHVPVPLPDDYPIIPLPPIGPVPIVPGIVTGYCTVRFLHAAVNYAPYNISIGSRFVANNLAYGSLSSYVRIPAGFRSVTVMSARSPRTILLRATIPFRAGDRMTIAVINTVNGIEFTQISDMPCAMQPCGFSCIRMVNLSPNSDALDVLLSDGRTIYSDLRYKEVAPFKRIRPGSYDFIIASTPHTPMPLVMDIEPVENTPMIVSDSYIPGYGDYAPLLTFYLKVKRNVMYTVYIIGLVERSPTLQTLIAED